MKQLKFFLIGAVLGSMTAGCVHFVVSPREASIACDGKLKTYNHIQKKFDCQTPQEESNK